MTYVGRFAPSPTGPLHAGSLVAALASWLDARAHGGQWLVRLEDVDEPRAVPGMAELILSQLAAFGLISDAPVVLQSKRKHLYEAALAALQTQHQVYRCYCSRKEIGAGIYSGTCRELNPDTDQLDSNKTMQRQYALRFKTTDSVTEWADRRLGAQSQNVACEIGDFVVQRADGLFAYQLAVVVDDAEQGVTHVVRGEDLADNTARQILLQQTLGLPTPRYLHVPLVQAKDGEKLSKQNGAQALDTRQPLLELVAAAAHLGLQYRPSQLTDQSSTSLGKSLMAWSREWQKFGVY
jgi:glutamyl-Q tRNA(Asp) synthetase